MSVSHSRVLMLGFSDHSCRTETPGAIRLRLGVPPRTEGRSPGHNLIHRPHGSLFVLQSTGAQTPPEQVECNHCLGQGLLGTQLLCALHGPTERMHGCPSLLLLNEAGGRLQTVLVVQGVGQHGKQTPEGLPYSLLSPTGSRAAADDPDLPRPGSRRVPMPPARSSPAQPPGRWSDRGHSGPPALLLLCQRDGARLSSRSSGTRIVHPDRLGGHHHHQW